MSIRIRSDRLWAIVVCCTLFLSWGGRAQGADELEAHRERFRVGYEKYKGRDFAGAIVEWEAIYRELGAERGYRLAFNLARAYDAYGDYTRAAESYESYLGEVSRRRDGPPLEQIVEKQAEDAQARLKELGKTRGRVKVNAAGRPVVVQVDSGEPRVSGFTAYVSPGAHTITWNPGTADERKVSIRVGEGDLEVLDPPPPAAVVAPDPNAGKGDGIVEHPPAATSTQIQRPFPAWALYAGVGATAVSGIVPVIYYQHASTVYDRSQNATTDRQKQGLANEYEGARTEAYASWAVPSALATLTLAATAYWFWGGKELKVAPAASLSRDAANAGIFGRF
jgi:hypothetical protein